MGYHSLISGISLIFEESNFLGFIVNQKKLPSSMLNLYIYDKLLSATNPFLIRFVVRQLTLHYNQNFCSTTHVVLKCCSLGQERCLVLLMARIPFQKKYLHIKPNPCTSHPYIAIIFSSFTEGRQIQ